MLKIVNLTEHDLDIRTANGGLLKVPPSGNVARRERFEALLPVLEIEGESVEISVPLFGEVEGLPDPVEGTIYVVSRITAEGVLDRDDVYVPGPHMRGNWGYDVMWVRGLSRVRTAFYETASDSVQCIPAQPRSREWHPDTEGDSSRLAWTSRA